MRKVKAPPRASILIESLRDIGYTLETALADVIDNSISAKASTIHLLFDTSSSEVSIGVLDDGIGMTEADLFAAMRLGSRSPSDQRDNSDLGRFGLGLKTASFSQCRRLTVVSRRDGETSAARWDLDEVVETDEWLIEIPDDLSTIPWVDRLGETGTLVVWEKLDRLVEQVGSDADRSHFIRAVDDARAHLELVFHRFLSSEPGQSNIQMFLNERPLEPFDPFHRGHPATLEGPIEKIKVAGEEVVVQPFTLPHHQKVTPAEWDRYAGPEGYVKNQGFYVYRGRRLIIYGTWFGLARQLELTKLARVRIEMPNRLDFAWKIDVRKSSAQPPYQVKERLRRIIEKLGASSKRVYTARGRRLVEENRLPIWGRSQNKNEITYRINDEHPLQIDFMSRLPLEMQNEFIHLLEITGAALPIDTLFADFGGEAQNVSSNITSNAALRYAVETTYSSLLSTGFSENDAATMMQAAEPFRSNWPQAEEILEQMSNKGSLDE